MPHRFANRTLLIFAALASLAALAPAQAFSESSLRRLFKVQGVDYDGEKERLCCSWPFARAEELRAFDLHGAVWLHDGSLRMPRHSAVVLREIAFRAPLHVEAEVRLARPSSILEFHLVPTGGEPIRPIAFVNRPVRDAQNVTTRTDGLVAADGGIRGDVVGGEPSKARDGEAFTVLLEVQPGHVGVSSDGAPPRMLEVSTPDLFSLLIVTPRGGADVESISVNGEVPRRSLEKLLKTGKTIARDERSSGEDDRLAARGFGAEWRLLENERRSSWTAAVDRLTEKRGSGSSVAAALQTRLHDVVAARGEKKGSELIGKWSAQNPDDHDVALLHGLELIRENALGKAVEVLTALVEEKRRMPEAWRARGIAHLGLDEPEAANACFEVAYAQERSEWRNNAFRGLARLKMGDFDRARNYLRAAGRAKEAPSFIDDLVELAQLLDKGPFGSRGKRLASDEYVIEASVESGELRALAAMLETFREYMKKTLPLPAAQRRPSRVWVFDSREEYMSFTAKLTGRLESSLGVYYPPLDTLLFFATMSDVQNLEVLFHEAFHQYLDIAVRRAPRWFNEGHAEYFGATKFDEKGAAIPAGMLDGRLTTMRVHFDDGGELVQLKTLMTMRAGEFMSGDVPLHYAQSWALVHFFRHHAKPDVRDLFDEYAEAILDGDAEAAWRESFATMSREDMEAMERRFTLYVKDVLLKKRPAEKTQEADGE